MVVTIFNFLPESSVVPASAVRTPARGMLILKIPSRIASELMIHFFIGLLLFFYNYYLLIFL